MYGSYDWLIGKIKRKQDALTQGEGISIHNGIISITTALKNKINGKQDKLTAGEGITITDENVISASGGGGGAMVVTFTADPDTMAITADKTVAEVMEAMLSMPVVGVLNSGDTTYPLGIASINKGLLKPCFIFAYQTSASMFVYANVADEWVAAT